MGGLLPPLPLLVLWAFHSSLSRREAAQPPLYLDLGDTARLSLLLCPFSVALVSTNKPNGAFSASTDVSAGTKAGRLRIKVCSP